MTATSVAPALPWAASSALCKNTEQQGEQQEGVQLVACNVEALGLKVGDKIEVKWHIESEGAEPYYKWWKATIVKCADSSEASTSSPQYELLYEAHEGFEQETAIVKFHSDRELQDVTQPTALLWRMEGDTWDTEDEEESEEGQGEDEEQEEGTDPYKSSDDEENEDNEEEDVQDHEDDEMKGGEGKAAILQDPEATRQLQEAIKVSTATYYLSYPATLAYALSDGIGNCVHPLAEAVVSVGDDALVVTVIGASDEAELAHLHVWKGLGGLAPGGVVLQMVGPEVPAERHMQAITVGPGVRMAFFKGEYSTLVDHIMVAGTTATFPTLTTPPSPAAGTSTATPTKTPSSPKAAPSSTSSPAAVSPCMGSALRTRVLPEELCALPNVLVGYNLGLTCPDYSWTATLHAVKRVFQMKCDAVKHSGASGKVKVALPWLITSNTQIEAVMEEEVLLKDGWTAALHIKRNPWGSLELLQSGTLANDLYRKSTWVATYQVTSQVMCKPSSAIKTRAGRSRRSLGQRLKGWATAAVGALLGRKRGREGEQEQPEAEPLPSPLS